MKFSLMSLMVDDELYHQKPTFIMQTILGAMGETCPDNAEDAYKLLNERGVPLTNGTASFEDLVRFVKENGFDGLDMMSYQMEMDPKEHKAILEKYGVVLSAVNIIMPFSEANCEEAFRGMLMGAKAQIDHAVESGAKQILLVPGGYVRGENMTREQTFQAMIRGLTACVAYGKEKGIPISTETLESVCVPWSSLGEMQRVFDTVPGLNYTHDSGNPLVANEDPLALCQTLWDRVSSVHFKDLKYTEAGENTYRTMDGQYLCLAAPGTGVVDFAAHLKFFAEKDYQGYITIEGGIPAENKWQEAIKALEYFRALEQQ